MEVKQLGDFPEGSIEDVGQRLLYSAALPRYGFCLKCLRIRHLIPYRNGDTFKGRELNCYGNTIRWTCPECSRHVRFGLTIARPEVLDEATK